MKIVYAQQFANDMQRVVNFLYYSGMPSDKAKEIIENIKSGIEHFNVKLSRKSDLKIGTNNLLENSIKYSFTTKNAYLVLCDYDERKDVLKVLSIKHSRELDYTINPLINKINDSIEKLSPKSIRENFPTMSEQAIKLLQVQQALLLAQYQKPESLSKALDIMQQQLPDIASGKITLSDLDKHKGR